MVRRRLATESAADCTEFDHAVGGAALGWSCFYRRSIFANVSAVFTAAVEDRIIAENPCRARSVRAPSIDGRKVEPWSIERVMAMHEAVPDAYQEMVSLGAGCGLRQGEIFGLALEDVDFLGGTVHVVRQIKLIRGVQAIYGPPKGGKERHGPLPETVSFALAAHITKHPPVEVTLPWKTPDGPPVTASLLFVNAQSQWLHRFRFNRSIWRPSLTSAGILLGRENGMHASLAPGPPSIGSSGTRVKPTTAPIWPMRQPEPVTCNGFRTATTDPLADNPHPTYGLLHVTSPRSRQMNGWTQFPIRRRTDEMRADDGSSEDEGVG